MKYFVLIFLFLFMMLVNSCNVRPMIYSSSASLPYYSKTTLTNFELINDSDSKNFFNFGVIVANDNDKIGYILISPARIENKVDKIPDFILNNSVTLLESQANGLLNAIEYSIKNWHSTLVESKGVNVEYIVAPEQEIISKSENVVTWNPTLRYNFQKYSNGSIAILNFGDNYTKYYFEFRKIESLNNLKKLLDIAVNKIK